MSNLRRHWCTYVVLVLLVGALLTWARFYTVLAQFAAAHGYPGWHHYAWPIILLGPVAAVLLLVSQRCSR